MAGSGATRAFAGMNGHSRGYDERAMAGSHPANDTGDTTMADELAPIATEVIFEDELVRVWNQVVPKGATIRKHLHANDYFLLHVSGEGPIEVTFHDGTGGMLGEHFAFRPKPGTADFIRKGHVETAVNNGEDYRAILVELKKS